MIKYAKMGGTSMVASAPMIYLALNPMRFLLRGEQGGPLPSDPAVYTYDAISLWKSNRIEAPCL